MGFRAIGGRPLGWLPLARLLVLTPALVLAATHPLAGAAPANAAAPALHVIPFPGTPDASPSSHIIFSSLTPSEVRSVAVTGSSSGLHTGALVRLPDGAGTTFIPDHPFSAGEQVSVSADLSSSAAGTASGDPGATVLAFSFTVATQPSFGTATDRPRSRSLAWSSELGAPSPPPGQTFHSAPGLHPPPVSHTANPDSGSGDIFLTPQYSAQAGPMILDAQGRLVWFKPIDGFATNLEVQSYGKQRVLTWFQQTGGSRATNEDVILNRSYAVVGTVDGIEGYVPDEHEFQLSPAGTAWLDAYTQSKGDLSSVGGSSDGVVVDCLIQERDVPSGQLLWEWHALGHIPLTDSFISPPSGGAPYDYFHLNSIQVLPNGNLLISARNTWSVYEIDRQTGRVIWSLGGRHSSFRLSPAAKFEWQHDAHLQAGGVLSVFDDASDPFSQKESQSSAKTLRLNRKNMTASLVHRYRHRPPLISVGEGSAQLLPNGNVFAGWGNQPDFTEFTSTGRQIFNGSFPIGVTSYRAYRFRWDGQPATRPSVSIARQPKGAVKVYVSWNGATSVMTWRVRGGARPGALKALATAPRTGFETAIVLSPRPQYLSVQAVNNHGKVIGTSRVLKG